MAANFSLGEAVLGTSVDLSGLDRGLGQAEHKTKGWTSGVGSILGTGLGVTLGNLATGGAMMAVNVLSDIAHSVTNLAGAMVTANAEFEQYETQFGVLLGSAEAAQERIQELSQFAIKTPFELPQVIQASKVLQSFGGDILATGDNLTLAGDMAAASGQPFDALALHFGRMYDAMMGGRPFGESAMRMQELGLLTGDTRAKLEEMQKAGVSGAEVWSFFADTMKNKVGGMMDKQSVTFEGMISNVKDWASATMRELGRPIFDKAKEGLQKVLTFISSPAVMNTVTAIGTLLADKLGGAMEKIGPLFEKGLNWITNFLQGMTSGTSPIINFAMQVQDAIGGLFNLFAKGDFTGAFGRAVGVQEDSPIVAVLFTIRQVFVEVGEVASAVWPVLQEAFAQILPGFQTLFDKIYGGNDYFWNFKDAVAGAAEWIITWLVPAIQVVAGWIANTLIPAVIQIVDWLQVNVPIAVQTLVNFWNTQLLPALQMAWIWFAINILPAVIQFAMWLQNNIPVAIAAVSGFVTGQLIPALTQIWNFISVNIIPLLVALGGVLVAVVGLAIRNMADYWNNVLMPALRNIWSFIQTSVLPLFNAVGNVINAVVGFAVRNLVALFGQMMDVIRPIITTIQTELSPVFEFLAEAAETVLGPALENVQGFLGGMKNSFTGITDAIQRVISFLNDLANQINNLPGIPGSMEQHSPSDWERALYGIADAMRAVDEANPDMSFNGGSLGPLGRRGTAGMQLALAGAGGSTFAIDRLYVTLERGDQTPEAFVDKLTTAVGVK